MSDQEAIEPTVTVMHRIAKYKGDITEDSEPYEIVWFQNTMTQSEFLALKATMEMNNG